MAPREEGCHRRYPVQRRRPRSGRPPSGPSFGQRACGGQRPSPVRSRTPLSHCQYPLTSRWRKEAAGVDRPPEGSAAQLVGREWGTRVPSDPWERVCRMHGRAQMRSTDMPGLLLRGARGVAAGRVALGVAAVAWPSVPARPWVGAAADSIPARVFGRALGARDLALGLGALGALQGAAPESASAWVAAGALSDALDVAASLASWGELPRRSRWLVVAAAGGASLAGAAGALVLRSAASAIA
jgi:hypothetical protein